MKLGTMLLRDGVINLDQLEAALRTQVLFGGKLGTNLVELGHLTLDQLTIYLARTLGVEPATQDRFEAATPRAIAMLPAALCERHVAFPLAFEEGPPARLHVAMAEPRDATGLAALARASGAEIVPLAAPELRVLFYLERHYAVPRKVRFLRAAPEGAARPPGGERRRFVDDGGLVPATKRTPVASAPPPVTPESSAPVAQAAPLPPAGLAETLARLETADSREAIADAVLRFARGRVEACVLFLPRERAALGWRGFARYIGGEAIDKIALPLTGTSCLSRAMASREPWRGTPALAVDGHDGTLLDVLGVTTPPMEVLAVPVTIGTRVVNLLYAHGLEGQGIDDGVVDGLCSVAEAAGEAFTRLIQAAKKG